MRKVVTLIIIGLLLFSGVTFIGNAEKTDKLEMKTSYSFSKPIISKENQFVTLEISNSDQYLIQENQPLVPKYQEIYTFPFGTTILDIDVIPHDVTEKQLDVKVMPSPKQVLASMQLPTEKEVISQEANYGDEPYPNTWADYRIGTGIVDGQRSTIVTIDFYPIQYYPSENIIKSASTIDVDINYKQTDAQPLTADEEYRLVIIAPSEFTSSLETLKTHKENNEISTRIITLDDIYNGVYFTTEGRDHQEQIKYFIKKTIENWNTMAILLVGGIQELPARETHIRVSGSDTEIFVSDLYYADIYNDTGGFASWDTNGNDVFAEYNWDGNTDEADFYPDVHIGRLACVDTSEVQTSVNKIITYETSKAYTKSWFTNIIGIGGDSFTNHYGDDSGVNEGEYVNEYVFGIMDGFVPTRLWDSNGMLSGISPTGVGAIENAFHAGAGFVDFSGHGNTNVWATHPNNGTAWLPTPTGGIFNSHILGLENGDMLPIVITGACSVGKYNKDRDCFSWSVVASEDGGGIASAGATALGYAYIGKWVTNGLVEAIACNMFKAYDQGALTFGEMWSGALNRYISARMDAGDYKTLMEWHAFGDPTLALGEYSVEPVTPDAPEGPMSGSINTEYTYSAGTTDPDGDDIYYLFDWGDGSFSGWMGPYKSGTRGLASYTWTERGDYEIRVKAKDDHGVQSDWSDPIQISMPKGKEINHPFMEFIETFFPHLYSFIQLISFL